MAGCAAPTQNPLPRKMSSHYLNAENALQSRAYVLPYAGFEPKILRSPR
jgi:hypothetical protein